MRIRRTYVAVLAATATAALAVAGVATAITNNVSSLSGSKITPSKLSATVFKPVTLFVHTHTDYLHPGVKSQGGYAKTVTVLFDDDGKLNVAGLPQCTNAQVAGQNIKTAWARCGPGATASHNAYLSPPTAVSGRASTAPLAGGQGNFGGCTLVFNGKPNAAGNPTNVLYTRVLTVPGSTPDCSNPANNTFGNQTVILDGTITNAGVADFGKKLTVPNIDALPLPLDDFTSNLRRASTFTARCHDANKILNMRGIFQYSGAGQATDTVNNNQACTVG